MLPLLGSGTFSSHQAIDWRVDSYNSSMTVPEQGIGFRLFSPSSTFNTSGMQTTSDPTTYLGVNGSPVLTNSGTFGFTPLVMDYWGGGAPPGIATAGYVALHWRGYWTGNSTWFLSSGINNLLSPIGWLSFSGRGFIRVRQNDVDVLSTRLNNLTIVNSSLVTLVANDKIDIYYWQLGEDWGGIVGKFVPQYSGQATAFSMIDGQYREAPVLSASIIPYSVATVFTLPQVSQVRIESTGALNSTTAIVSIPMSNVSDVSGWRLISGPRRLQYTDPITKAITTLKRGQLIKFYGGFQDEQYSRFTGRIVNFNENGGTVQIECQDFSERMARVNVQNYPDFISYETFGYFNFSDANFGQPVFGIPAYDNWPLEHAIKDLAYKAGIDPRLFFSVQLVNDVSGGALRWIGSGTTSFVKCFPVMGPWPSVALTAECWIKVQDAAITNKGAGIISYIAT